MTNKEIFIKKIEQLLNDCPDFFGQDEDANQAIEYFESLKKDSINLRAAVKTINTLNALKKRLSIFKK